MGNPWIRQLEERDLDFVYQMNIAEQWNDTAADITRMFLFEPNGCFIAEVDGKPAGHVFAISYGSLGWIGLLIVKPEYRRMGIGKILTTQARDYLLSRDVATIKLEAVPEISSLYRDLGFTDEHDSLRLAGKCRNSTTSGSDIAVTLKNEDMTELATLDAEYFGADRARVLRRLHQEYPQLCFVSRAGSAIIGYLMCRTAKTGYKIGPWVCDPTYPQAAEALLKRCLSSIEADESISVGVPAPNTLAVGILQRLGFRHYSKSIRMRFGSSLEKERAEGVFAIGGPMKG